ncbi:MAG: NAD-dependent epimerase/dehydratase family protein [Dehalococcoidia bacterium]
MRILVTGGAGFIASHVADAMIDAGHEVAIVDDLSTGKRANLNPSARFFEVDITGPGLRAVFAEFRPEVVDHHAAQASVKVSLGEPARDLAVNAGGTVALLNLCREFNVGRFIYAASGGTAYGEPKVLPIAEDHPVRLLSNYGVSKYAGELYVDLAGRSSSLETVILRYANVYGPRQDPHGEAGVVAIFTGLMLAGEPCTIDGDGEQAKDYVYAVDVAAANLAALTAPAGTLVNVGTGVGTTVNEIHRELAAAIPSAAVHRNGPPRPGDVRQTWLDNSHARRVLGWTPAVDFATGIRHTVAWYRARATAAQ